MKRNRFLCTILVLSLVLSMSVQGFAFTAFAENDATSLLLGDANLDFSVNVKDATNIQKVTAKINSFGKIATETADVDKNETINIKDATAIQKWVAHMETPYLVGEYFEYFGEFLSKGGFIRLNVNPEIRIGYNADGTVTGISAENSEAEALLEGFTDYHGKSCEEVIDKLIAMVTDAGYLIDDIDGENKVVVIQLESESKEPAKGFIDNLRTHAEKGTDKLDVKPEFVKIEEKDYDGKYATDTEASPFITLEKATEIALAYSGVWAEDAVFEEKEYDIHRGTPYYELEFSANGYEFECKVNALNGKVVNFEKEKADHDHSPSDSPSPTTPSVPDTKEYISIEQAKEIALTHAGVSVSDATFKDRDLDLDDGTPYYEIEFLANGNEYEYEIHAVNGTIIKSEREPADKDDLHNHDRQPVATEPSVTPSKPEGTKPQTTPESSVPAETKPQTDSFIGEETAKLNALSHAGVAAENARFEKTELDRDNGKYKYEIEFEAEGFEYDYEIDALTGKVLDAEKDRADR